MNVTGYAASVVQVLLNLVLVVSSSADGIVAAPSTGPSKIAPYRIFLEPKFFSGTKFLSGTHFFLESYG